MYPAAAVPDAPDHLCQRADWGLLFGIRRDYDGLIDGSERQGTRRRRKNARDCEGYAFLLIIRGLHEGNGLGRLQCHRQRLRKYKSSCVDRRGLVNRGLMEDLLVSGDEGPGARR